MYTERAIEQILGNVILHEFFLVNFINNIQNVTQGIRSNFNMLHFVFEKCVLELRILKFHNSSEI